MGAYTAIGIGGHQAHIEKLAEPLYQRPNKRTVSVNHYINKGWKGLKNTKTSLLSVFVFTGKTLPVFKLNCLIDGSTQPDI